MADMINALLYSSEEEDEQERRLVRRRKIFRERINFDFVSEIEYRERFRMSAEKVENLCLVIGNELYHQNKGGSLSVKQQICIGLHWLGSGGQYHTVGDMHGVSKATVCRCVKNVVNAINRNLFNREVSWPDNIADVVNGFYNVANFPHVIGVIDGILIPIDAPVVNEAAYVDRHGDHSLNCMFICGPTCMVYYLSARWPGSVHDARVLRTSNLYEVLEEGELFPNSVLLGDSGYPLKRWLMVPCHQNPNDPGEETYNRRLKSTRQTIERCLGILKEKFPCLNHLRLNPTYAAEVVKCCTTLCNFSRRGEPEEEEVMLPDVAGDNVDVDDVVVEDNDGVPLGPGILRQAEIINMMR